MGMVNVGGIHRVRWLLLAVLLPAGPQQTLAQFSCGGAIDSTPLRIENLVGARALAAVVNCTDGGTVEAVWAGAVTLDAPILIGSGTFLSVAGEGELAEVQGGSEVRLFDVSPSGGLALTGLKLSGGSAARGGAIHSSMAAVTVDGCVFDSNAATAGDGGGVWVEGGTLTIFGGEFFNNSASGNGGAVLAIDSALLIQDGTRFEGNKAIGGGALFCVGPENATTPMGLTSLTAACLISEAMFTLNSVLSDTLTLTSSDEYGIPSVEYGTPTNLYGGGPAEFYLAVVNITDSVFEFNSAQLWGGAIFGGSGSDMTIDGCVFRDNATPGYGGAIAASSATTRGNTLVTKNKADEGGGGVSKLHCFSFERSTTKTLFRLSRACHRPLKTPVLYDILTR